MLEVNQFVFDGALNAGRPFRALFAGGGTGDGTLLVAAQAKAMGESLKDPEDKELFLATFDLIPAPRSSGGAS